MVWNNKNHVYSYSLSEKILHQRVIPLASLNLRQVKLVCKCYPQQNK